MRQRFIYKSVNDPSHTSCRHNKRTDDSSIRTTTVRETFFSSLLDFRRRRTPPNHGTSTQLSTSAKQAPPDLGSSSCGLLNSWRERYSTLRKGYTVHLQVHLSAKCQQLCWTQDGSCLLRGSNSDPTCESLKDPHYLTHAPNGAIEAYFTKPQARAPSRKLRIATYSIQ